MTLPVVAITNASTCLSDKQVAAAIPTLQRQVTGLTILTRPVLLAITN